uniref:Uncharacterized protein n=1 Tax=Romanomermis culicivorax TaxID=13658 RepID=A0A915HPM8_ROMCU
FLGNYAYHEALKYTEAGVVSVLSVTSSFFTLLLAGVLPATPDDKMTLSKFCLVLI